MASVESLDAVTMPCQEVLHRVDVGRHHVLRSFVVAPLPEDDLFAAATAPTAEGVDGHMLHTALERQVCNWLYLAQLAHAYRRALPVEEALYADFYLPGARVYIECWEEPEPADRLSLKLKKQDIYQQQKLRIINIKAGDRENLDEKLGRSLMEFGIRV